MKILGKIKTRKQCKENNEIIMKFIKLNFGDKKL